MLVFLSLIIVIKGGRQIEIRTTLGAKEPTPRRLCANSLAAYGLSTPTISSEVSSTQYNF